MFPSDRNEFITYESYVSIHRIRLSAKKSLLQNKTHIKIELQIIFQLVESTNHMTRNQIIVIE